MKRCSRCDQWLPVKAFTPNRARRDGLQTYCQPCQQAYMRDHYRKNREYYLAKATRSNKKIRRERRGWLKDTKAVPCADCGGLFPPWAMDFDHMRGAKRFNLSRAKDVGRKGILEEAAKCEIVCSNCHRDRTYRRLMAMRP